ncbi:MAG: M48 family metalloprotease [Elusimicrobia bacterium]|nr:M48 family metalloprotease [Elusimicrobiota bacterium]
MIIHSILFLSMLAGQPSASAEGFGDVLHTIEDISKSVTDNEEASGSEDEAAQKTADDEKDAAVDKALKGIGVDGTTADDIQKSLGFARRTKKAVESARDLDPADERQIGRVAAAEILAKYSPFGDEGLNKYVQTVGQAVAMASDRPQTFSGYHFQVLNTEEVNALSIPGGFIFVTKGILRLVESEDELACVLAHEVAHVALGHGSEAIVEARRMKAGLGIAADASKTYGSKGTGKGLAALRGDVKAVMDILMRTGYGHGKEFEADAKGALYAQRTGYDPSALTAVMRKLKSSAASQGGFLKTHPKAGKRAQQLEEAALEPPAWYSESETRDMRFESALAALGGSGE